MSVEKPKHPYELIQEQSRLRTWFVHSFIALGFLAVLGKGVYLTYVKRDFLDQQASIRSERMITSYAPRGTIYDRNGKMLAVSLEAREIWIDTPNYKAHRNMAGEQKLLSLLNVPADEFNKKLGSLKFFPIAREIPMDEVEKIKSLHLAGIHYKQDFIRNYPFGPLFAQTLGFTNSQGEGGEGLEKKYNSRLQGTNGKSLVLRDGQGNVIEDEKTISQAIPGEDLKLTLDANIQYFVHDALIQMQAEHQNDYGAAVVLDAQNGNILAIDSLPDFDPNKPITDLSVVQNKAVSDSYEPGSIVKPFVVATAMQKGLIDENSEFNTSENIVYGKFVINDTDRIGIVKLPDVLKKSSNVGAAHIAMKVGAPGIWQTYHDVGFGSRPGSGLYDEAAYPLPKASDWKEIQLITRAYGHGIAVSLLQIAKAYLVFTNEGLAKPIQILESREQNTPPKRIFSADIVHRVNAMVQGVVSKDGTAPLAKPNFYTAAGKTGTTKKNKNGVYISDYTVSFVGFAPVEHPRVIVAVVADSPKGRLYYGGWVAAPAFKRIVDKTLPYLGVNPDDTSRKK